MKYVYISIVSVLFFASCTFKSTLKQDEASFAIEEYYSEEGCFSKLSIRKLEVLDRNLQEILEKDLIELKKGKDHKVISWHLESINGILVSEDGNSATVDFTLNGKTTSLFKYQKYQSCTYKDNTGPWDMVAEFVNYDTGWKIKSKPKGR